jgi:hypothetical protein
MKARIAAIALLAGALAGAATTRELFEDDFRGYRAGSDGFPVWHVESGTWRVESDGLTGQDCEGHFAVSGARAGRRTWADYTLWVTFRVTSYGADWRDGPWFGVRCDGSGDGYTVGFYERMTALHKTSQGRSTTDEKELATSPVVLRDAKWHRVGVRVDGSTITVILDGKTIIEAEDKDWNGTPPVRRGGIVLGARRHSEGTTRVIFRSVRVEAVRPVPDALRLTRADAERMAPRRIEGVGMLDYIKEARSRQWTRVPRKVLTFYYTWYGLPERHGQMIHWGKVDAEKKDISASTHYPAVGAYDSHDPATIDHHIDLARDHGIDVFVTTWWGRGGFDDHAFRILLERAKAKDFEVTIYWETAPGGGETQVRRAVDDLAYVLGSYGDHPAFFRVDGKPVIFIYGRVMGEVAPSQWPAIVLGTRQRTGRDFLLIADGYREEYARVFDGLHIYNPCGWVQKKPPDVLRAMSRRFYTLAVGLAKRHGRIACMTIIPGYDDTKIRTPGINAERQGGETYRVLWEEAIRSDPDWIIITSFNEWHEGSEIEPSLEHGDQYIRMTGRYAKQFKESPFSRVPVPDHVPLASPERAKQMRDAWEGRTIGILPGAGGKAVYWLLDTGVALKELAWEDVVDGKILTPAKLPVLLYAGYESYVQTVREKGDVDRALRSYLDAGGLLVTAGTGPFPFYYNENQEPVIGAANLGIPIVGIEETGAPPANVRGWEMPPKGRKLHFEFGRGEGLDVLPATAPFPRAGDPRWRPCWNPGMGEGGMYRAIAKLTDEEGRDYGDAIADIERPGGKGKILYVWMRMPDVVEPDLLFHALFQHVRTRIE